MTLSEFLTAVGEALVNNTPPPAPETVQEYHAVIEQHPDQAWRWKATEQVESLIVEAPVQWDRSQQRRLIETLRRDEVFRQELITVLGMEYATRQAGCSRIP